MNSLLQDLRYGARMLVKNPGFTVNSGYGSNVDKMSRLRQKK
jgi:hypothetical protein